MTFPRADYQPARRLIPTMRVVVESFLGLVGIFLIAWAAYGQNVGGTGGSSGGGGGGSVTQGTIPWVEALSTTPSIANGNGVVPTQGGSALSATNGGYTNLLQGNAAIASGNPLFAQLVAGSAIAGKFGIDQTTAGTTNGISIVGVNAATALAGAGAVGAGAQRIAVGQDTTTIAGATPGRTYNTIAASQSTQALTGGSGGATGDYLSHCVVIPTSTSPGVVTIIDNATTIYAFPGGATSLSNLVPFTIPVGAVSVSGAWKVTTGANLSVVCVGKFT